VIGLSICLQACTQVDNYLLGKDNSPKPTPLASIKSTTVLTQQWTIPIGKFTKSSTYLKIKPVVKGNLIYTADAGGLVQAVNKHSGKIVWSKKFNQTFVSGPSIAHGSIALGTNSAHVLLLRQSDGQELWRATLSSDVLSKPLISNQKVIVKTIDGQLYAFNLKTGEKIWVLDHGSPSLILKASSSPVILNKLVLVGFSDGKLDAVDIDFGHVVWQRSIAYARGSSDIERLVDIDTDPIVRSNIVYLASYQGYVGALSLDNGQFIWNKPASTFRNMVLNSNTLYMTDSKDIIWAFNAQNGEVKWKQPALKARGLTDPVLMGHWLILGDKTGYMHVVSTTTGELLGRTQLNGAIDISPSISGHDVFVMTANGQLHCISVSV
jgi:outer membrane protein assembly factor BamB